MLMSLHYNNNGGINDNFDKLRSMSESSPQTSLFGSSKTGILVRYLKSGPNRLRGLGVGGKAFRFQSRAGFVSLRPRTLGSSISCFETYTPRYNKEEHESSFSCFKLALERC